MRTARILILWVVGGLIIGFLIWYLPPKLRPQYTAQTFIRVLPGFEKGSAIALIKDQSILESLVDRDEVQKTGWFKSFGKTKDDRIAGAVTDLKKRFRAGAVLNSDLVTVRMTCRDGKDAARVLNEAVDSFLKLQRAAKKKQIASDLGFISERQVSIQKDLDLAEMECDNVRRRYGFTDLEEHGYPDRQITRLMDLHKREDNYALEIKEVQFLIKEINEQVQQSSAEKPEIKPDTEVRELKARLRLLENRFKQIQWMREEAEKRHIEFNLAKAQYTQRVEIRDERRQILNSIKTRVEELKILYDDPDSCGLQFVEDATAPRQADMRPWQIVIPTAAAAAVIAGIGHIFLTRRASKVSP